MSAGKSTTVFSIVRNAVGNLLLIVTIILVVFKLTGNIAWSWWYVLAPFWVPWLIGAFLFVLGKSLILLAHFVSGVSQGRAYRRAIKEEAKRSPGESA